MSTNAPNAATLVTTPSKIMSGRKSRISSTPSLNVAVVNAGRGSRPGFSSSFKISLMVGTPKRSSAYLAALSVLISAVSPMTAWMSFLMSLKIFSTSGYDSGCTAEASSGLSPPITRRKPAACSKVLSPSRGTAFRPAREVNAPFMSRYDTMACATDDDKPDVRRAGRLHEQRPGLHRRHAFAGAGTPAGGSQAAGQGGGRSGGGRRSERPGRHAGADGHAQAV